MALAEIFASTSGGEAAILGDWTRDCPRFATFLERYESKIIGKLRRAKGEDLADIVGELRVGYMFCKACDWPLEYEAHQGARKLGPDYSSKIGGEAFHIEVKRVRDTAYILASRRWTDELVWFLDTIPSSLALMLTCTTLDDGDQFLASLQDEKARLFRWLEDLILKRNGKVPLGEVEDWACEFCPGLTAVVSQPLQKSDNSRTSFHGSLFPVGYTQKEYRKYGDAICRGIGQLVPGAINVIIIVSDSTAHEEQDLKRALDSLEDRIMDGDTQFFRGHGYEAVTDFVAAYQHCSAVAVRTNWHREGGRCSRVCLGSRGRHPGPAVQDLLAQLVE